MKRESLTQIVATVQTLTIRSLRPAYSNYASLSRIRKAAVNEIIRLDSAPVPSSDLANRSLPGAVSVYQNEICKSLKP